jgi:hypothetical protein
MGCWECGLVAKVGPIQGTSGHPVTPDHWCDTSSTSTLTALDVQPAWCAGGSQQLSSADAAPWLCSGQLRQTHCLLLRRRRTYAQGYKKRKAAETKKGSGGKEGGKKGKK